MNFGYTVTTEKSFNVAVKTVVRDANLGRRW